MRLVDCVFLRLRYTK